MQRVRHACARLMQLERIRPGIAMLTGSTETKADRVKQDASMRRSGFGAHCHGKERQRSGRCCPT